MSSRTNHPVEETPACSDSEAKIIEWEDLQQELARLWSLSSTIRTAKERKEALALKLEAVIQERNAYLKKFNEIEDEKKKLEDQKLAADRLFLRSKRASEQTTQKRDQLRVDVKRLMTASKSLSRARQQMQEAHMLLAGPRGYGQLRNLWRMVYARQQHMVTQISTFYPLKESSNHSSEKVLDLKGKKPADQEALSPSDASNSIQKSTALTITGLRMFTQFLKKPSFFADKKELQKSATALGYVGHTVTLIAAYLNVPLRYPVKFCGSRSHVQDHASSAEFPLFFEGQETTRSAYAVFLLNKDIEQLLNSLGAESLGPRSVLPNLLQLMKIIWADEYIKTPVPRDPPRLPSPRQRQPEN